MKPPRAVTWRRHAALLSLMLAGCSHAPVTLTVSVAASLQNAIAELAPLYQAAHPGVRLAFNYGGSGMLEQQIENGAPADVFVSAAPGPMDKLAAAGLIDPPTRRDLLRNSIVLIAPKDRTLPVTFQDLAAPGIKLIALGDPASVPAGEYGRQVLETMNLLDAVRPKLVLGKDVRQVLTYVESGNTDAGIVYATDARESHQVRVAEVAPEASHRPVIYPAAVIKASHLPAEARGFLDFLAGARAGRIFAAHGFLVPGLTAAVPGACEASDQPVVAWIEAASVRPCKGIDWQAKAPAPQKSKPLRNNVGQTLPSANPAISAIPLQLLGGRFRNSTESDGGFLDFLASAPAARIFAAPVP
jgi:molybdate transport system substrate-binding protein